MSGRLSGAIGTRLSRSGAVPWTPLSVQGLYLWLRADVGTGESWTPTHGSFTPTQPTAGLRPVADTLGGRTSFAFDGVDDYMQASGLSVTDCTVFAVCLATATNSGVYSLAEYAGGTNTGPSVFHAGGSWTFRRKGALTAAATDGEVSVAASTGAAVILCGSYTSNRLDAYVNSLTPTSSVVDVGALVTCPVLDVGTLSGPVYNLTGEIAEIIISSQALSSSSVATCIQYLARYYGVTLS